MANGTDNFISDLQGYLATLPPGTGLVFVGHSFGGDSILSFLQAYQRTQHPILFAGVLDPVDGAGVRSSLRDKKVGGHVQYFYNRWQTNEPWPVDFAVSGEIKCGAGACDQASNDHRRNVDGTHQRVQCGELEVGCDGAGTHMELKCVGPKQARVCTDVPVYDPGTKRRAVSHQSLPIDAFLQREMLAIISDQIKAFATPIKAGQLALYHDLGRNGTPRWADDGKRIGHGWDTYKSVFGGQNGNIYAITQDGIMEFYQYDIATGQWPGGDGKRIGRGWDTYKFVFGGDGGEVYAITQDGIMEFYRYDSTTGQWPIDTRRVGHGWGDYKFVFGGEDGIIYAVTQDGVMDFYQYNARDDRWTNGGQKIGHGWENYKFVFGGQSGVIYAIAPNGVMDYYRYRVQDGKWDNAGNGQRIGNGWENFKFVFGGDGGFIYTVDSRAQ